MGFDRTFHAPRLGDTPSRDKQAAQSLARSILQGPNDLLDVKLEKEERPRMPRIQAENYESASEASN